MECSDALLKDSSVILEMSKHVAEYLRAMFGRVAFLHWCARGDVDEMEFTEAENNMKESCSHAPAVPKRHGSVSDLNLKHRCCFCHVWICPSRIVGARRDIIHSDPQLEKIVLAAPVGRSSPQRWRLGVGDDDLTFSACELCGS